jgi:hypothetical protein
MINLIPKEEKKKMMLDFYFRIGLLFVIMLDFCALVLLISLSPSFFLSSVKVTSINAKLEVQNNEPLPLIGEQSLAEIKDINNKLALVENAEKNKFTLSVRVVNSIILNKRSDIKITQIVYENNPITGKKISITGTAPSREVLLLFRQALEDNSTFKDVNLPISNFVKGSNIQFNLNLIPA